MAHIAVVTGAGGFVASELVNQLLQKGYIVRATVRDASDSSKVRLWTEMEATLLICDTTNKEAAGEYYSNCLFLIISLKIERMPWSYSTR